MYKTRYKTKSLIFVLVINIKIAKITINFLKYFFSFKIYFSNIVITSYFTYIYF